jgi:hypothetical protein
VRWTLELPSDRKLDETAKGLNGKKVIVVGEPVFPYWMSEEGLSTFRRGYLRAYEPAMRVRSIRPPIPADNEGRSPENAKECPP